MEHYKIIYEKSKKGYSAYVPDLPGCTSAGADRTEVERNILEAIELHLEVLEESKIKKNEADRNCSNKKSLRFRS